MYEEVVTLITNQGFAMAAAIVMFVMFCKQLEAQRTQIAELNKQHAEQIAEMNAKHQEELSAVLKQISANTRILKTLQDSFDALRQRI